MNFSLPPAMPPVPTPSTTLEQPKGSPIWKPLPISVNHSVLASIPAQPKNIPINKNFGKRALEKQEIGLSSSTDELLSLATTKYQKGPSSYDSDEDFVPPVSSMRPIHITPSLARRKPAAVKLDPLDSLAELGGIPFGNLNLIEKERDRVAPPGFEPTVGSIPVGLSSSLSAQKNFICRYFAAGYCSRGDRCTYVHSLGDPSVPVVTRKIVHSQFTKITDYEQEIYSLCLNQHGCRFLQKELDEGGPDEALIVYKGVIQHIVELMQDPFGNYLCQKLIEHCSPDQRLQIVKGVSNHVIQISKNIHGTRAIQRLIEKVESPEEIRIIRESLRGGVVSLIQDLNGNHVIQKCLHKMEPNDNQFIYDAVAEHCVQVATHRHGCCVLQRCIDHGTIDQKHQLVGQIQKHGALLIQDPFGNYVVQYALNLSIEGLALNLMEQLEGKLYRLSKQKFSSNVVEKCLKSGDPKCVLRVMRELLLETPNPSLPAQSLQPIDQAQYQLLQLLQDSYGNYVVQTCLSEGAVHAPREYRIMVALIAPHVYELRNTPHCKRICHLLNLHPIS